MDQPVGFAELAARYDAVAFDAYGVLVDGAGALPEAAAALAHLRALGKPMLLATNDASRLPQTIAERMTALGLDYFAPPSIVTSGDLLAGHFTTAQLLGKRCLVLGTADSATYVERAGADVIPFEIGARDTDAEVICVCDDAGFPFLPAVEHALSVAMRRLDRGEGVDLVLPNPDLIYPKAMGEWGFTAGTIAMMIEAGLARRFGSAAPTFSRLGKPGPGMLLEIRRRAPGQRIVFVGDQVETDIAAAKAAGMDSALLLSGVSRLGHPPATDAPRPEFVLASLRP